MKVLVSLLLLLFSITASAGETRNYRVLIAGEDIATSMSTTRATHSA